MNRFGLTRLALATSALVFSQATFAGGWNANGWNVQNIRGAELMQILQIVLPNSNYTGVGIRTQYKTEKCAIRIDRNGNAIAVSIAVESKKTPLTFVARADQEIKVRTRDVGGLQQGYMIENGGRFAGELFLNYVSGTKVVANVSVTVPYGSGTRDLMCIIK